MSSWTGIPELRESYRKLGARNFSLIMGGTLAYIGIGTWLTITTDFPSAYGATCHGRGCFFTELWYSTKLLHHGVEPMLLFVWLWSMPAVVAGAALWALWRKRQGIRLSLFADDQKSDDELND